MTRWQLTCVGIGDSATRLYHLDGQAHVREFAWSNGWVNTDITAQTEAAAAAGDVDSENRSLAAYAVQ